MGGIEGRFELLGPEQGWYKRGPLRDPPLDPTQECQPSLLNFILVVLYFVTVYTADETFAGTDSKVDILLSGTGGDSGEIVLQPTDEIPNPFERGRYKG